MHLGNDKQVEVTKALSTGEDGMGNCLLHASSSPPGSTPSRDKFSHGTGEREGFVQDHQTVIEAECGLWPTSPSPLGIPIYHRVPPLPLATNLPMLQFLN